MADIGPRINSGNLESVLDPQRKTKVSEEMQKLINNRTELSLVNLLSFNEIIRFASFFNKVSIKMQDIETISKVRNLICHADLPLIESYQDVKRLSAAKNICIKMIDQIQARS